MTALRTWQRLAVGDTTTTPRRTVTESMVTLLASLGGYTHPLFTDAEHPSPFPAVPLPGQALLLLMGGLAEQSGVFDDTTVALLGFDAVRFARPALPGDTVVVEIEVLAKEPSTRTGVLVMAWRCLSTRGDLLVDATARMLVRLPSPGGSPEPAGPPGA